MKRVVAASVAALSAAIAHAASPDVGDWRTANERVHDAGGWKAYAREIDRRPSGGPSATPPSLLLETAIERTRGLDPGLQQILANASRDPRRYLLLTEHQRSALTRESQLIAEVSSLFYATVAAQERVNYQLQVVEAASIAAELASRMRKVGNLNLLHQAEEQLSFAQTELALSRARVAASAAQEALIQRLQLSGEAAAFTLPNRLPELPKAIGTVSDIDTRLLAITSANPALVRAQSEVRQAIAARNHAHALAQHYRDAILPLQKQISEETLLHYNGMIIGIFDLLKDAKHQVQVVESYLNALAAYWQAETALHPKLFALREQFSPFWREAWK